MNSISCGLRLAVSYFQTERDNVITYMGRKLLLNNTIRGLSIHLYRNKEVIYKPNYCTVFNSITPSTLT